MTDLRQAAQQALDAFTAHADLHATMYLKMDAITALRAALAEPVQEPVAWRYTGEPWFDGNRWHDKFEVTTDERVAKVKDKHATPLYTTPPQRNDINAELVEALREMLANGGDFTAKRDAARAALAKVEAGK